jgi:hypothetical protein
VIVALDGIGALASVILGTSNVVVAITGLSGAISAIILGTSSVSGTLAGTGDLVSSIDGTSSITSALTGVGDLASLISGQGTIAAALSGVGSLSSSIAGSGLVIAVLTGNAAILANLFGASTVVATLTGSGTIIGQLVVSIFGVGSVVVSVSPTFDSGTIPKFIEDLADDHEEAFGLTSYQIGISDGTPTQLMDIVYNDIYSDITRLQAASVLIRLIAEIDSRFGGPSVLTASTKNMIAVKSRQNPKFAYFMSQAQTLPLF